MTDGEKRMMLRYKTCTWSFVVLGFCLDGYQVIIKIAQSSSIETLFGNVRKAVIEIPCFGSDAGCGLLLGVLGVAAGIAVGIAVDDSSVVRHKSKFMARALLIVTIGASLWSGMMIMSALANGQYLYMLFIVVLCFTLPYFYGVSESSAFLRMLVKVKEEELREMRNKYGELETDFAVKNDLLIRNVEYGILIVISWVTFSWVASLAVLYRSDWVGWLVGMSCVVVSLILIHFFNRYIQFAKTELPVLTRSIFLSFLKYHSISCLLQFL
ncbi:hypothetical protein [Bifidobacterium aerophilum]|uniref:Uncharacterized protein n=1 Tax=Bifidobacterium aerophilum TaxID=1798155 RepID=A0A6N9Z864_9BIFI|nr:hypothetical protein [Bifidobacterium aerophilum]NEG90616.1 hypothetical protein [Bifidobacterium aerophilum]